MPSKDKPKIKNCEFCNVQFVDDTEYNVIACQSSKCRTKYAEWVHGDSEVTQTCTACENAYHPHELTYFDKGICWECELTPTVKQSKQPTLFD